MKTIRHGPSMLAALRASAVPGWAPTLRIAARLASMVALVIAFLAMPVHRAAAETWEAIYSDHRGVSPQTNLTLGSDGNLYGATYQGGVSVYHMEPSSR